MVLKRTIGVVSRRLGLRRPAAEQPVGMGRFTLEIEKLWQELVPMRDGKVDVDRFAQGIEKLAQEIQHLKQEVGRLKDERAEARIEEERAGARIEALECLAGHPEAFASSHTASPFSSPAVSIVMPTWNREGLVGAAIRSVQAQTFTDWELIVIDDGSADGTKQLVQSFGSDDRIRYVAQEHLGQVASRNHALRLTRGELVAYLDSDNIWYPEFLSAAVAVFAARPDVDCAYGATIRDHEEPHILHAPFDRERLLATNYIDMSAFVHRRALVERYGDFDERLDRLVDWDLLLRYTADAPAFRLPVRAVRYRAMDGIRISDTQPFEEEYEVIRGKWGKA